MAYDFNTIAGGYDRMNHLMTLGLDKVWRRRAATRLSKSNTENATSSVLDVACGTGDMAIAISRVGCRVTGVDLSTEMLAIAQHKAPALVWQVADAEQLPFADGSFDAVACAFGVRNFVNLEAGLAEMSRVLKRGGMLLLLELSEPTSGLAKVLYRLYALHLIPLLGKILAGSCEAYTYLPRSIMAFDKPEVLSRKIEASGMSPCTVRRMTFGVCTMYTATKQ